MNIAITGASGFIGTELIQQLNDSVHVIGLTRNLPAGDNTIEWRQTDYSVTSLQTAFKDVDVVIHLAAVRGTTTNREDYVINETITENVLSAMDACKVGRIVLASTISVYDDETTIPWTEEEPLQARTMYGDSKIACEKLVKDYSAKFGFDYSIVRIAQVLGLGEKRRGMMNVFLDTAAAGGEITVIGKSVAKRQYIYVKDLVAIIEKLAKLDKGVNITVNAGMSEAYTNLEIAQITNSVYGNTTPINYDDSKIETIKSSCMNNDKLMTAIGYNPMDMAAAIKDIRSHE